MIVGCGGDDGNGDDGDIDEKLIFIIGSECAFICDSIFPVSVKLIKLNYYCTIEY